VERKEIKKERKRMYDLVVIKPKLNIIKVVSCLVITAIIVVIATLDGIFCASKVRANQFAEQIVNLQEQIEIYQAEQELIAEQKRIEEIRNKIPTWDNLQSVATIYTPKVEKEVYLTFDDGPSKAVTIPILDLLKQEDIKATFFVLGTNAERNPDIIKRAYEEGHYIANHGYSHVYESIYQSSDTILAEYYKTEEIIRSALQNENYSSHLFRYPGGSIGGKNKQIKNDTKPVLTQNGIHYLDWNALTKDSEGANTREEQLQSLVDTVQQKKSVVVLMHDSGNKTVTYETLPDVIAFFRANGYQFKNIYDLMS